MKERLQKILSARGVTSRRGAEALLLAGRVTCNGRVCGLGDRADPEADTILLDGKPIPGPQGMVYIMLNKPRGYVTTLSDDLGRRNAAQLVAGCGVRVYPVGRLDRDSEGLLLFTNDGAFAHRLTHPAHQVDKTYLVWTRGDQAGAEALLRRAVVLDGRPISPPEVRAEEVRGDRGRYRVTIHEGRNRQLRRMCALAGLEVTRLMRVREGPVELGGLERGAWRYLTAEEVGSLNK